jgi:hypothetical protein
MNGKKKLTKLMYNNSGKRFASTAVFTRVKIPYGNGHP